MESCPKERNELVEAVVEHISQNLDEAESVGLEGTSKSRLLAGIRDSDLFECGRQRVQVRSAAFDSLESLANNASVRVFIVSASWSLSLIQGALSALPSHVRSALVIRSNNLVTDPSNGMCTGEIEQRVVFSSQKLAFVNEVLQQHPPPSTRSIFVGDALTDLPSLLRCDIGVLVNGASSSLLRCCELLHISVVPLTVVIHQLRDHQFETPPPVGVLYMSTCWDEILEFAQLYHDTGEQITAPN